MNTINKVIIIILIVVVFVIYYFFVSKGSYSRTMQTGNNSSSQGQGSVMGSVVEVVIKNFNFGPATVNIKAGQEIKWTNQDSAIHTITGANFESGQISAGQSFSMVFNNAGNFDYHCSIHPSMKGQIIVNP